MINDDDDLNVDFDDLDAELESDLGFDEDDFETFEDKKQPNTLGQLWRENALFKVGSLVLGFVVILFIFFALSGKKEPADRSVVGRGASVSAPPGTEQASPAYVDAVEEENEARVEQAIKEGESALPTPISPPVGRLSILEEEAEEDPLQRWRRLQEERLERELTNVELEPNEPTEQVDNSATIQALSSVMSNQMQAVLETRNVDTPLQSMNITSSSYLGELERQAALEAQVISNAQAQSAQSSVIEPPLLNAAKIEYAQIITQANSDVPGPVLAELASGPLAGSRLLGSFRVQQEMLTVTFDTIVLKSGEVLKTSAVALDPNTTLPGMATDINRKYFRRIVLPAAAAFVQGAARAITQAGRTTIIVEGDTVTSEQPDLNTDQEISAGLEEGAQAFRQVLQEMQNNAEVQVSIRAGTPMAVLFLEPVSRNVNQNTAGNPNVLNDVSFNDDVSSAIIRGTQGQ